MSEAPPPPPMSERAPGVPRPPKPRDPFMSPLPIPVQVMEASKRLFEWTEDWQIGRLGFPHYKNPGELKRDIRIVLEHLNESNRL